MRASRILTSLLAGCVLWLLAAAWTAAEEPTTTLTVTPATLALAPGESAEVLVAASNPFTTVQSIVLSTIEHRGIAVEIEEPKVDKPTPGDVVWSVTVTRKGADLSPDALQFRVDLDKQEADGSQTHNVKTAALQVTLREPNSLADALQLEIKSGWETIEDNEERQVFLVAVNKLQVPLTITAITIAPMLDVESSLLPSLGQGGYKLEPRKAHLFAITLKTKDKVEPGPRLMVAAADATWKQAGQLVTGSIVLSHPYQVGVYGESAILAATKIPSMLLLPGFLFLTAILFLRKLSRQQSSGELELDFTKPTFWFLGITLSLLAALLYPVITRNLARWNFSVLGQPIGSRNLIQAYGFVDILLLWLGATLLGVVVWALINTIAWVWRKLRTAYSAYQARKDSEQRKLVTPDPNDDPLETLRKIGRNGKRLADLAYSHTVDGQVSPVWQLPAKYPAADKVWVMPTMHLRMIRRDFDAVEELKELQKGEVGPLIKALERYTHEASSGSLARLEWNQGGIVKGVEEVNASKVTLAPSSELRLVIE